MNASNPTAIALCVGVLLSWLQPAVNFAAQPTTQNVERHGRITAILNSGWRFSKGEHAGAEAPRFDDSAWQSVRLPHDWAIAGPFDANVDGYAGKLPWQGVGWYRKTLTIDGPADGRRVYLDFDGVMAFPKVYVNGQLAGEWDYGYMSFRVDATPHVKFGEPNVVAVRVDTRQHGTRWYPGAGIYRDVSMTVCNPIHIAHWGIQILPRWIDVIPGQATLQVITSIENHTEKEVTVIVNNKTFDPDGKSVDDEGEPVPVQVAANTSQEFNQMYYVRSPQRWDIEHPKLYKLVTTVVSDGKTVDQETNSFGFRDFKLTANDGFQLNGRRVQLYGVNLHHDHGPLGAAFYSRAMERQLTIMKEMGVNALRTSHNPPAPEVLDLCDRLGILVWDECFDKWNETADRVPIPAPPDGEVAPSRGRRGARGRELQPPLLEHAERQLRNLVKRDRNHPSVIFWSIANEVGGVGGRDGLTDERVTAMREFIRKYDDTRPVGLGHHVPEHANSDVFQSLDFVGWNYDRRYHIFREQFPDKPIIYSESASALSTRGFYELPLPTSKTDYSTDHYQVDSYDYNAARWSDIPDREFDLMERDRFVAGEFVWTGFDYLGEPTPFSRQARSSYFGIVDLCGFPKDRYYLYRSHWRPDAATVHILPHWNWPERVGQNVPVFVYTNGDSGELFLNGKSLGRRQKSNTAPDRDRRDAYYAATDRYRLKWMEVTYQPGELKAVAYKGDELVGTAVVRTTGPPAALRLRPDRLQLAATGDDLCYVTVDAVDPRGDAHPLADNLVRVTVEGPAEIAAVASGNPLSLEPFQAKERKLFHGKALVILRTKEGPGGDVRLTAESDGLEPATATVISRP